MNPILETKAPITYQTSTIPPLNLNNNATNRPVKPEAYNLISQPRQMGFGAPKTSTAFKDCSIFDKKLSFMIKRSDQFEQREQYLRQYQYSS